MGMRITVISLFPEWVRSVGDWGVVGRAVQSGGLELETVNPRDFAEDRGRRVDDRPYGGGAGMVLEPEPLAQAIAQARSSTPGPVILTSPRGEVLSQALVRRLAREPGMVLVCGRYEGVDERLVEHCVDMEVSLGDFVLSGGELAAMAMIDAVARLLPGTVGDAESLREESFEDGLLEHPHYTRPPVWRGRAVPEVLLSGDHAAIARWRRKQALGRTWLVRPELLDGLTLDEESTALLRAFIAGERD